MRIRLACDAVEHFGNRLMSGNCPHKPEPGPADHEQRQELRLHVSWLLQICLVNFFSPEQIAR